MKNASLWFDLALQSFLPSFCCTSCYIFTAICSSLCFGFFSWSLAFGFCSCCYSSGTFFCPVFLSSCFFLSWSWKFPGNVFKTLVSTHCTIQCCSLPPPPSLRRVLDFGSMQFSWTLISDPAFCTHQLSVRRTHVFCCIWKFIFRKLDNLVFFLLFTSKCWNPVLHSLSFSEWFWMPVWNLNLQHSSLVFEKEKVYFLGFSIPPAFISSLFPS